MGDISPVRAAARALRLRIEAGDVLTMAEAVAACVTRDDALSAFERTEEREDGIFVHCCGSPCSITSGIFGDRVECLTCGAKAVDATSPIFSPLLERGNSYITCPSREWLDQFGIRNWLVMHEGNRAEPPREPEGEV